MNESYEISIADQDAETAELSLDRADVKSFFVPDFTAYTIRPNIPTPKKSITEESA